MEVFFVTGIGTGIGKTLVSAVLSRALQADYWKPIQCGSLEHSDSDEIRCLSPGTIVHPETYRLKTPASPHFAAQVEGVKISISQIRPPTTATTLIVEGAGGLMVPINEDELLIDLIIALKAKVVLVSENYLGSINHTLLSIEALNTRQIPITGIIFNGPSTPSTEQIILKRSGLSVIAQLEKVEQLNSSQVTMWAEKVNTKLFCKD